MSFKPLLWLEGILGAGKTKACNELGKRLNLRILEEPVASNPYLGRFYEDPKAFAFPMQILLLHRRYALQQLASYECTASGIYGGAILDRSISGDRVFAELHLEAGNITKLDFETYLECYEIMARSLLPPTMMVFLDASPETAFNRMKKRDRKVESAVPLDYLQKLHAGYVDLIARAESGLLPWAHAVKVLRIPWNHDTTTPEQWDEVAVAVSLHLPKQH